MLERILLYIFSFFIPFSFCIEFSTTVPIEKISIISNIIAFTIITHILKLLSALKKINF
ncbi:hypothetical protein [Romboutsia ilealis]|uniref:hypothetical protein n=1 Tax=Romboutsia ilealis TaxID=1115758 RepID=UPI003AB9B712